METMETKVNEIEINGVKYVPKDSIQPQPELSEDYVLVRTYSAGVHVGYLKENDHYTCALLNARRIYYWSGACSCSQIAVDGVDTSNSKIAVVVPAITLADWCEIIPMTTQAKKCLEEAPIWKK